MDAVETKAARDVLKQHIAAYERAAVETLKQHRAKLDAEHAERVRELASRPVAVYPVLETRPEFHVNVAALPVDVVVKVLKELTDAALAAPVPVVPVPVFPITVNPTPVVVDFVQLELMVGTLTNWVIQYGEDAAVVRNLVADLSQVVRELTAALDSTVAVNEALLGRLSENRVSKEVTVVPNDDGTFTIK